MSSHNNSTSGTDKNKSNAWENMSNPDSKPTGGDDTKKMGGNDTQPKASSGDPKKV